MADIQSKKPSHILSQLFTKKPKEPTPNTSLDPTAASLDLHTITNTKAEKISNISSPDHPSLKRNKTENTIQLHPTSNKCSTLKEQAALSLELDNLQAKNKIQILTEIQHLLAKKIDYREQLLQLSNEIVSQKDAPNLKTTPDELRSIHRSSVEDLEQKKRELQKELEQLSSQVEALFCYHFTNATTTSLLTQSFKLLNEYEAINKEESDNKERIQHIKKKLKNEKDPTAREALKKEKSDLNKAAKLLAERKTKTSTEHTILTNKRSTFTEEQKQLRKSLLPQTPPQTDKECPLKQQQPHLAKRKKSIETQKEQGIAATSLWDRPVSDYSETLARLAAASSALSGSSEILANPPHPVNGTT